MKVTVKVLTGLLALGAVYLPTYAGEYQALCAGQKCTVNVSPVEISTPSGSIPPTRVAFWSISGDSKTSVGTGVTTTILFGGIGLLGFLAKNHEYNVTVNGYDASGRATLLQFSFKNDKPAQFFMQEMLALTRLGMGQTRTLDEIKASESFTQKGPGKMPTQRSELGIKKTGQGRSVSSIGDSQAPWKQSPDSIAQIDNRIRYVTLEDSRKCRNMAKYDDNGCGESKGGYPGDYNKGAPFPLECSAKTVDKLIGKSITAPPIKKNREDFSPISRVEYSALLACGPSAINQLLGILDKKEPSARLNSVTALGDMGVVDNSIVVPALLRIIEDINENPYIREVAINSLLSLGPLQGDSKKTLSKLKKSTTFVREHQIDESPITLGKLAAEAIKKKMLAEKFDAGCPLRRFTNRWGYDGIQFYLFDPKTNKCKPDGHNSSGRQGGSGSDSCLRLANACLKGRPIVPNPPRGAAGAGGV
jgi:hypothetical protein